MKKLAVFLLIAIAIYACGNAGEAPGEATAQAEASPKEIDGEKIYRQYCITCHGLYGDMGASGAFDLTSSELSVEERVLVITNGRNAMAPFKSLLSEEKIKAVAEYTLTLADKRK